MNDISECLRTFECIFSGQIYNLRIYDDNDHDKRFELLIYVLMTTNECEFTGIGYVRIEYVHCDNCLAQH